MLLLSPSLSLATHPCTSENEEVSGKLDEDQLDKDVDVVGQCF